MHVSVRRGRALDRDEALAAVRPLVDGEERFRDACNQPLLHKLGVVDTPAVLVIKRPANIYHEFVGFVDRDVVAQAVTDAR